MRTLLIVFALCAAPATISAQAGEPSAGFEEYLRERATAERDPLEQAADEIVGAPNEEDEALWELARLQEERHRRQRLVEDVLRGTALAFPAAVLIAALAHGRTRRRLRALCAQVRAFVGRHAGAFAEAVGRPWLARAVATWLLVVAAIAVWRC